jgi:phage-related minor tail protein
VFVAVVLLSALAGTFLASIGFNISVAFVPLARNAFSALIAMVFHPLTTAAVNALPQIAQWIISRLPGGKP